MSEATPEFTKPQHDSEESEDESNFTDPERVQKVKTLLFNTHKVNTDLVKVPELIACLNEIG